jgi:hypothetical protein
MSSDAPPPAGWYDDPTMVNTRRYWDGQKWTEHRQERTAAPSSNPTPLAPAEPPTKPTTAYAWTVALLPLAFVVLAVAAINYPALSTGTTLVYLAVASLLCYLDSRVLRRHGLDAGQWWLFLIPVYLIVRTRRASSTPAIPIVWFVTFALSLIAPFSAYAGSVDDGSGSIDTLTMEVEIQSGLEDKGFKVDDVTCADPGDAVSQGDQTTCDGSLKNGSTFTVLVTFNSDGSYVWQVQ